MFVNSTATSLDLLTLDEPLPRETPLVRLLRFPLGSQDSALLPLEQITEILPLEVEEILPIPEMPSCVLGIGNWRGQMLWLVDLNHLAGCSPLYLRMGKSLLALVVEVNGQSVGLVVEKVNDIESHDLQQLVPPTTGLFPAKLLPFILGYLPGEVGIILNITAIAQYPLWKIHRENR
jgi:positive phototaxis protein PixI